MVTAHVGETANYAAHEVSANFAITKKALTITAEDLQRWQYGAMPDMIAEYDGLADGGVAVDTSLRDIQIQPEFIFNEENGGYTNSALDQVGVDYVVSIRNALARNYEITYVEGNFAVTEKEPRAELAIHGMIDNADLDTNIAYYGDEIQLYAYGYYQGNGDGTGVYNTSSLIAWELSAGAPATIDEDGLLTITGVGTFTVTLYRGSGTAQISTSIEITALKQEVKVVLKDQDVIYSGVEQTYDESGKKAVNAKLEEVSDDLNAKVKIDVTTNKRTDVGSQVVLGTVSGSTEFYQSETYGGLFTINDKEVTVAPNTASVIYGDTLGALTYTESGNVGGVDALTDAAAVSVRDAYINLDVYDGYEILVAGRENINYNVKYLTETDAEDVDVTAKALTVATGTIDQEIGLTSGCLNPAGDYPAKGEVVDTPWTLDDATVRMYGEPNWVMVYELLTLVDGDSVADLLDLTKALANYKYDIAADANVSYEDKATQLPGRPAKYEVETDASMIDLGNYSETYDLGVQNIYQRPVTLSLRDGLSELELFGPDVIKNGALDETAAKALIKKILENNMVVGLYNGEGGLAEKLNHTIVDLDIQVIIDYTPGSGYMTVTVVLGNINYWLPTTVININVVTDKIIVKYGPMGRTNSKVTMVGVNELGEEVGPMYVSGNVYYVIYERAAHDDGTLGYAYYRNQDPYCRVKMVKTSSVGVYRADYDRLPAGSYIAFAIADGYTIIE